MQGLDSPTNKTTGYETSTMYCSALYVVFVRSYLVNTYLGPVVDGRYSVTDAHLSRNSRHTHLYSFRPARILFFHFFRKPPTEIAM